MTDWLRDAWELFAYISEAYGDRIVAWGCGVAGLVLIATGMWRT